jgi:hypothetical protein
MLLFKLNQTQNHWTFTLMPKILRDGYILFCMRNHNHYIRSSRPISRSFFSFFICWSASISARTNINIDTFRLHRYHSLSLIMCFLPLILVVVLIVLVVVYINWPILHCMAHYQGLHHNFSLLIFLSPAYCEQSSYFEMLHILKSISTAALIPTDSESTLND